jgi:hypothetical protein
MLDSVALPRGTCGGVTGSLLLARPDGIRREIASDDDW